MKAYISGGLGVLLLVLGTSAHADGVVVDKIYHPYVQPLEQELEWRAVWQDQQTGRPDDLQLYRFAYGRSFSDDWSGELYLVGSRSAQDDFDVEAWELEAQYQLTEQGEYWADWGLLFELEKESDLDAWEFSTGILGEKEWGRWSGTANLMLIGEWGSDIPGELETRLGLQARYRHSRSFEPALELYSGEDTRAVGPAVLGQAPLGGRQQLKWEAGLLFGIDSTSPETTLRLLLELEF